jgi:hypothetical protein
VRYYDYKAAITSHWLQSGIGPREAAAELRPACSDVEADEGTIRKLEAKWQQEEHDAVAIVFGILSGLWNRLAGFDCEDVQSPADHRDIVGYLAAATSNKFAAENVTQSVELNGDLKLSLTHEGKSYAFTFEDFGSWRNLPGLLTGLNGLLEKLCIQERFVELYAGEGPGVVVFALPDKFVRAAHKLGIRLELPSGPTSGGGRC